MISLDLSTIPSPVLITGAGGFIGSHLAELFVEQGLQTRAFVHYNSQGCWRWLDESAARKDIQVIAGDIRDYDAVSRAMRGCKSVLHLAALIGIPYSYVSPLAYVKTNIEGTYNILESARNLGLENIVITSTSETYGSAQRIPIDENHPASAQSPYAASKVAADSLALSYHRSFNLPVKIARPFNTYGPRQSARAIIPTIISQILLGDQKLRLGNLNPTRDLTFVKDTVRGILSIAASDELIGAATNIGTGHEIAIGDLVLKIAELMKVKLTIESDPQRVRPESSEVDRLCGDASKLRETTGWMPQHSLDQGLSETIDWLKGHQAFYRPEMYAL